MKGFSLTTISVGLVGISLIGLLIGATRHEEEADSFLNTDVFTSTPTPFLPVVPTPEVSATMAPTQEFQREVLPYVFDGVFFNPEQSDESVGVRIIFTLSSGSTIEVPFVPVAYKDWMDEDFGSYCHAINKPGTACVWDSGGVLTILAHSGCAPLELAVEPLRNFIYGGTCVNLYDFKSEADKQERIRQLEVSKVSIRQGTWTVDDLVVDYFGEVPFEHMEAFRSSMGAEHIRTFMDQEALPEEGLILVSSVRDNRHEPYYSAGNFFLVIRKR